METLQTWWATELYPMRERDQFGVSGEFEVVLAADAQATVAALQARVRSLEAELVGKNERIDKFESYYVHQDLLLTAEEQLTQRTAELEAVREQLRLANIDQANTEAKANDLTAELEAANIRADKAVKDRADVLNVKSTDGLTSSE